MHRTNCMLSIENISIWEVYPTKKETHHYDFPIKFSFWYENVNCHDLLISDQILLKLECGVDEYLYLPCIETKHTKANGKRVFEAFIQYHCLHGITSMVYNFKVWKRYVVVM